MRRLALATACVLALTGCAMEGAKGLEDHLEFEDFDVGKADSFRQPTEHGDLTFGLPSSAALEDDHLFHTWTFTLTDEAEVDLPIAIETANLDTVMYLYRRNPGSERWGRYIARNDDDEGSVASRIQDTLGAGEYRILVKGYKSALRGSFSVTATCDGAGCPGAVDCNPDAFPALPTPAEECTEALSAAIDAHPRSGSRTYVSLEARCSLPEHARLGLEAYYHYWNDIVGWEDAFGWISPDPDEPLEVEVAWTQLSSGATFVECDAGGDEAAMDIVISAEGELLAIYQHNQSPTFQTYCAGREEWGDEECGRLYLDSMIREPAASNEVTGEETGVTLQDARDRLPRATFLAFDAFARENGMADTDVADVWYTEWESADGWGWEKAARVTIESADHGATSYELAAASTTQWLFTKRTGYDGPQSFLCEEL